MEPLTLVWKFAQSVYLYFVDLNWEYGLSGPLLSSIHPYSETLVHSAGNKSGTLLMGV